MTIAKPDIPGTVIRFIGDLAPRILPSAARTVAVPLIHDWGPVATDPPGSDGRHGGAQLLSSFADWTALFGDSDTPGRTAVAGAFAGQGLPGLGGAGGVLVARMAASSAAAASVTIQTSGGAPVNAETLTAIYKGTRGNRISYIVDPDPSQPTTRDRLRLLFDGVVRETYLYARTDLVTLTTVINARSQLVTAANLAAGRLAGTGAAVSLTGGNDGTPVLSGDHLNALGLLTLAPASLLAPYDLEDSSILAAYVSWIQGQDQLNFPYRLVVGGAAGEAITDALARTLACSDPHVINFGVGTWHDNLLNKDLSTAQLAPRLAGIIAGLGARKSATYAKIGGLTNVGNTLPSQDAVRQAVLGGVTILMAAAGADASVRVAKAVTTFTSTSDATRPLDVFGDPRLVGILDDYVREMKAWGDDNIIGTPVNDDSRAAVRGQARKMEAALLREGLILPGNANALPAIPEPWVVCDDPGDPALADAIPYTFGWQFADTTNAILGEGHIR